jgi:DinB family protein
MDRLAADLLRIVDTAEAILRAVGEQESAKPVLAGGWSRKQVIGHLIDSASNNHQRFVRASLQDSLEFPAYDTDGCVQVQAMQQEPWTQLMALWTHYNRHLAHVIAHLPPAKLETPCRIGSDQPVTLRFLAEDYVRHLLHHLSQIDAAAPSTK